MTTPPPRYAVALLPRPAWVVEVREITDRWPQDWPDGRQPAEEV